MIFTREQFDTLGFFDIEEFPITDDQNIMFNVFNHLPQKLQGLVISNDFDDEFVQFELLDYLCGALLGMTVEQYFESEICDAYFDLGILIDLDFDKLKNYEGLEINDDDEEIDESFFNINLN